MPTIIEITDLSDPRPGRLCPADREPAAQPAGTGKGRFYRREPQSHRAGAGRGSRPLRPADGAAEDRRPRPGHPGPVRRRPRLHGGPGGAGPADRLPAHPWGAGGLPPARPAPGGCPVPGTPAGWRCWKTSWIPPTSGPFSARRRRCTSTRCLSPPPAATRCAAVRCGSAWGRCSRCPGPRSAPFPLTGRRRPCAAVCPGLQDRGPGPDRPLGLHRRPRPDGRAPAGPHPGHRGGRPGRRDHRPAATYTAKIPMSHGVDSLNVAAASE